jgi:hypothetical protein
MVIYSVIFRLRRKFALISMVIYSDIFRLRRKFALISMVIYSAILSAAAKNRITQLLLAPFPNATWVDGPGPKETPL